MAENKKSFILYTDLLSVVRKLVEKDRTNKTNYAGELFLTILMYVNDKDPIPTDFIVEMAFEPIKLSLKRDLKKYEVYIEKQRVNGAKGGRPKKTQKTQPFLQKPKKADSVSVSDNVNDINNIYEKFVDEVKDGLHSQAIDEMYMRLKIKKGSLTPLLKSFKGQLIIDQTIHKNTLELRKHFNNWLNTQERVGKLNQYKTNKTL